MDFDKNSLGSGEFVGKVGWCVDVMKTADVLCVGGYDVGIFVVVDDFDGKTVVEDDDFGIEEEDVRLWFDEEALM